MNLTYGYLQLHGYRCVHTVADTMLIGLLLFGQLFSCLFLTGLPKSLIVSFKTAPGIGSTENARHETTAQSKMQGWKLRERKQRHQNARVETARSRKCGTMLQGVENATQASMDSQKNTWYDFSKFQRCCWLTARRLVAYIKTNNNLRFSRNTTI